MQVVNSLEFNPLIWMLPTMKGIQISPLQVRSVLTSFLILFLGHDGCLISISAK